MDVRTIRDLFIEAARLHSGIQAQQFGWIGKDFLLTDIISNTGLEFVMTGLTPTYDNNNLTHSFQLAIASVPAPEVKDRASDHGVDVYDTALEALINLVEYVSCNNLVDFTINVGPITNIAPGTNYALFGVVANIDVVSDRPLNLSNFPTITP